jgi:hypothetical protein
LGRKSFIPHEPVQDDQGEERGKIQFLNQQKLKRNGEQGDLLHGQKARVTPEQTSGFAQQAGTAPDLTGSNENGSKSACAAQT